MNLLRELWRDATWSEDDDMRRIARGVLWRMAFGAFLGVCFVKWLIWGPY